MISPHVKDVKAAVMFVPLILYDLPDAKLISFLTVVVPVVPPIVSAVAAPAKLSVVAVVFNKSNDVLAVVIDVVNAGLVPNTKAPDPVSSVTADARFAEDGEIGRAHV